MKTRYWNKELEREYQHKLNQNFLDSIVLFKSKGLTEEDAVKLVKIKRLKFENVVLTEKEKIDLKRIEEILGKL